MTSPADPVELLLAEREIRRVMALYCRGADRGDHALLRSVLLDDAHLDFGHFKGGPDAFIAHLAAFPAVPASQHHITNMLIEIDGDQAEVEAYCIAVHGGLSDAADREDAAVFVRYLDRLERHDGRWRIARHIVVWDWNQNIPSTDRWAGPLYGSYTLRPRPGRKDPSYAELPRIALL